MTKIQHTRRGRPAAIAESDEKQVIKDYRKLGSVKAVAEKWSVSYPTIRKLLLKHDVKISGAVSPVANHPLLGTGSDGDVAKALGVHKATVMRARVKAGIKPFQYVRVKDRQP